MNIRQRGLPAGWYPPSRTEVIEYLEKWNDVNPESKGAGVACIVPHAGWYFSGKLAFRTIKKLKRTVDTIVIIGGHLPEGTVVYAAFEEGFSTPLGEVSADIELLDSLKKVFSVREDIFKDNTVEIQLPIVKYLFPDTKIAALRVGPSKTAIQLGEILAERYIKEGKRIAVIGSTDLTHYGASYGFYRKGTWQEALQWVENVNDKMFLEAVRSFDLNGALNHAKQNKAACSAGAAAAAASFAKSVGAVAGDIVDYYTSASIHPSDSFVGYGGIIFSKRDGENE